MKHKNANPIDKLERKLGKYAIQNISLYLIVCYGFGYIINMVNPLIIDYLSLNPALILRGQVWRIFTWILVPPSTSNVFFVLITLYFYYSIGTSLEHVWGTFRYNLYLFSGMLFTVLGSILLYALCEIGILADGQLAGAAAQAMGSEFYAIIGRQFSTYYINMSIFLGYAATFPQMEVLFMMIFPIKVKWLGMVYAAMLVFDFIGGNFISRFVIGASLLNFIVFFLTTRNTMHISPKQMKRRHDYKKEVSKGAGITKHKCAICGKTEQNAEGLEFRFCSKCEGNYEYCQEHLFTHEHIKKH